MADSLFVLGGWGADTAAHVDLSHLAAVRPTQSNTSSGNGSSPGGNNKVPALALAIAAAGLMYSGFRYATARRNAALVTPPRTPPRPRSRSPEVENLARQVVDAANAASPSPQPTTERWIRGAELGRGSFGVVFEGFDNLSGQRVAIKEMKDMTFNDECTKEFKLLNGLRNPFVVSMYALEPDGRGGTRLILELCTGGSLLDALQKNGPVGEHRLRCYARQLLLGLGFLHKNNIIHRDIKPANVLVDAQGRLKLTDFGMSRHMDSMHTRTGVAGSPVYMSPEALEGRYKPGTDLWALGATLCQMATGQIPWSHVKDRDLRNPQALMLYIAYGQRPGVPLTSDHHPHIPSTLCEAGQHFFKTLFAINVDARGTCEELLQHPFITNGGPAVTEDNYLGFLDTSTTDSILTSPVSERDSAQRTAHGFDVGTHTATTNDFELASAGPQARVQVTQQPLQRSATDATPSNSSVTRPPTATTGRASNGTVTTTTTTTTGTRQSQADGVSTATEHPDEEEEDPAEYGGAMPSPSSGGMDSMHAAAASHVSSSSSAPTTEFLAASCHPDDPLPP